MANQQNRADVVMFGDSLTANGKWNNLFLDINIVNAGVCGDTTHNLTRRMNTVYKYNPKYCFIMAGFNDIDQNIDPNETYENYIYILKKLKQKNIIPVIMSTTYAADFFKPQEQFNSKIDALNNRLKEYASKNDIAFVDLNKRLTRNHFLLTEFRIDHVHFNDKAYEVWKNEIKDIIYKKTKAGIIKK